MFLSTKQTAFAKKVLILFLGVYNSYQVKISEDFWVAGERFFWQSKWINKFKSKQFYYPACTAWLKQIPKLCWNAHRSPLLFSDSLGNMKWGNSLRFNNPFSLPILPPASEFMVAKINSPAQSVKLTLCIFVGVSLQQRALQQISTLPYKEEGKKKDLLWGRWSLNFRAPHLHGSLGEQGVAGSCSLGVEERKQLAIKKHFWKTA